MAGKRNHFIPASFLGLFSNQRTYPSRSRRLIVGDKSNGRVFQASASDVGCINNLYGLTDIGLNSPYSIDKLWTKYENGLPSAIDKLIRGSIDAETWLRVLVPFVSCMLVRTPDFEWRLKRRFVLLGFKLDDERFLDHFHPDAARLMEIQHLLALVLSAKWMVLEVQGPGNLITNDVGYTPFINPINGDKGLALPLDLRHILTISPQTARTVVRSHDGEWFPVIEYIKNPPNNHFGLNKAINGFARRFIYGPDKATISHFLDSGGVVPLPLEPGQLGFIPESEAIAYEFTWHELISALKRSPDDQGPWDFRVDYKTVALGWHSPIMLPANLISFPSALHHVGNEIRFKTYDSSFYLQMSTIIFHSQSGMNAEVVKEVTEILSKSPNKTYKIRLLIARAQANADLGNIKAALLDSTKSVRLDPNNFNANMCHGYVQSKDGNFKDANVSFSNAIKLDPASGIAYLNRGMSLYQLNKLTGAFADFSHSLDLLPDNQNTAQAFFMRGNVLVMVKRYKKAVKDFSSAILLSSDPAQKANFFYRRAVANHFLGKDQGAIEDLTQAITNLPHYFDAISFRAQIYLSLESYRAALSDFKIAINLATESETKANLFRSSAICYSELGMYKKADSSFNRAIKLTSNNGSIYYDKGLSLLLRGQVELAIKAFEATLDQLPSHTKALNNLGICKDLERHYKEAIDLFNRALASAPNKLDRVNAYRNKTISLAKLGDFDKAQSTFQKVVSIEPDSINTIITKGRLLSFQGDYSKALEAHLHVQSIANDIKFINPFVGIPIILMGDVEKAFITFNNWIYSNPSLFERIAVVSDLTCLLERSSMPDKIIQAIDLITPSNNPMAAK